MTQSSNNHNHNHNLLLLQPPIIIIITMGRTTSPPPPPALSAPSARTSTPASPRSYRKTSRRKGCATCKPNAGTPSPSYLKPWNGTRELHNSINQSINLRFPSLQTPKAFLPLKPNNWLKKPIKKQQPLNPLPLLQRRQRLPRPPDPLPLPPPHPPRLTARPPRDPHPAAAPVPRRRRLRRRLERALPPRAVPTHVRVLDEGRLCRLPRRQQQEQQQK